MDSALLAVNAILVLVTAVYVVLTWRLAKAAEESLKYARRATESAEQAVLLQRSAYNISFQLAMLPPVEDVPRAMGRSVLQGVSLTCTGDAVWVKSVDVTHLATVLAGQPVWRQVTSRGNLSATSPGPWLLQSGEVWSGFVSANGTRAQLTGVADTSARSAVDGVRLGLTYGLEADGEERKRTLEIWEQPAGT